MTDRLISLKETGAGSLGRINADLDPAAALGTAALIGRAGRVDINPGIDLAAFELYTQEFSALDRGHRRIIYYLRQVVKIGPSTTTNEPDRIGPWLRLGRSKGRPHEQANPGVVLKKRQNGPRP